MQKEALVFIGGSAVQAVLKNPWRLSIDLDVWYSGDVDRLVASLGSEFKVSSRRSSSEVFSFFKVVRLSDGVEVKLDFLRHPLLMTEEPFKRTGLDSSRGGFSGYVATPDYLLASKLVALAVNTLGRRAKRHLQTDLIKDVLDANLLLDEYGLSVKVWPYFWGVCRVQNKFLNASFSVSEVASDAVNLLLDAADVTEKAILIRSQDLGRGNFGEYLLSGSINKPVFAVMVCRLVACLSLMRDLEMPAGRDAFVKAGQVADARVADRSFVRQKEAELIEKGLDKDFLKGLRTLAQKALIYLHAAYFPTSYSK